MTAAKPDARAEQIQRFHAACGSTLRAWAGLEGVLVMYVRELLATDEARARIVWSSLPTLAARLALLRRLGATYLTDAALKRLTTYINQVQVTSEKQALIVEAQGGLDPRTSAVVFTAVAANGATAAPFPATRQYGLDEIELWPGQISALETELVRELRSLAAAVRGSPRRTV